MLSKWPLTALVCASALGAAFGADLPNTDDVAVDIASIARVHRACTFMYARKYSRTKEPAGDVADAALSSCSPQRGELVQKVAGHHRLPEKLIASPLSRIEGGLRSDIIRFVVEDRN